MFDIIAFNHAVLQWQPKMVQATEANKELAYAWIRDMAPSGSTFIDGALRLGFKMAGMGAYDKAYPGVAVDTIILLSDGAPTDNAFPDSKLMDPEGDPRARAASGTRRSGSSSTASASTTWCRASSS